MNFLISLVPLVLLVCLLAGAVQLSARLLRRVKVPWRHGFVYAIALFFIAAVLRLALTALGIELSVLAGLVPAMLVNVAFGAWYFESRATTASGDALGHFGAARLSAVACGLLLGVSALLVSLGRVAPAGG